VKFPHPAAEGSWLADAEDVDQRLEYGALEPGESDRWTFIACVPVNATMVRALCGRVLISVHKGESRGHLTVHLLLTLLTVISSWMLVHTVFGLRYAHAFYGDSDQPGVHQHAGGLIFPGDRPPDYFDFAYFSFVVGMTCQVSDVQITSRRMRRLTLVHSVLSFGFNTIILALLINTVSGLL
jgi:uncharacterized membrane protein